jgi:hypothetical protein
MEWPTIVKTQANQLGGKVDLGRKVPPNSYNLAKDKVFVLCRTAIQGECDAEWDGPDTQKNA